MFSFNDENLIDPILRDRIHIIRISDPSMQEKIVIGTKYLLKEIQGNIGFKNDEIILSEDVCKYIIMNYTPASQKGVRGLKKCIESMLLKINTARYLGANLQKYKCLKGQGKLPITINVEMVNELLKDSKPAEDKYLSIMYL